MHFLRIFKLFEFYELLLNEYLIFYFEEERSYYEIALKLFDYIFEIKTNKIQEKTIENYLNNKKNEKRFLFHS